MHACVLKKSHVKVSWSRQIILLCVSLLLSPLTEFLSHFLRLLFFGFVLFSQLHHFVQNVTADLFSQLQCVY